jgi:NAD(P)-dependent dehydrogenase (short-subunit alcohol dehydrogenase family)
MNGYRGSGQLQGKMALVTGGDSGIGRAVAIAFAKEGADVAISFLEECEDARQTRSPVDDFTAVRMQHLAGHIHQASASGG